jgi:hypothetical protein
MSTALVNPNLEPAPLSFRNLLARSCLRKGEQTGRASKKRWVIRRRRYGKCLPGDAELLRRHDQKPFCD